MHEIESYKTMIAKHIWKNHDFWKNIGFFAKKLLNTLPPELFEEIIRSNNKIEELVSRCKKDENMALFVLENLYSRIKLGKYDKNNFFQSNEQLYIKTADLSSEDYKLYSGEFLFEVCNSHDITKQYILKNLEIFKVLLSPQHYNEFYQNTINIRANTCHFTF